MSEQSVPALGAALSNSGRWGADDERGTLNFLNAQTTLRAASLIRTGRMVAASHDFIMDATPAKPRAFSAAPRPTCRPTGSRRSSAWSQRVAGASC